MSFFDFTSPQLSDDDRQCIENLTDAIEELNIILLGLMNKQGLKFDENI